MDAHFDGLHKKVPNRLIGKEMTSHWVGYVHSHWKFRGKVPHPEDGTFSREPCLLLPHSKTLTYSGDLQKLLEPTQVFETRQTWDRVGGSTGAGDYFYI